MKTRPKPDVGTLIECSEHHLSFKNTNIPCIRIVLDVDSQKWITQPASANQGLMVYVNRPARVVFSTLKTVRIYSVSDSAASAEVVPCML